MSQEFDRIVGLTEGVRTQISRIIKSVDISDEDLTSKEHMAWLNFRSSLEFIKFPKDTIDKIQLPEGKFNE